MIEICDNRNTGYQFKQLYRGDVFCYQDKYAIKIDDVVLKGSITVYNAVDLYNGELLAIGQGAYVVECKDVRLEIDE